MAQWIISCNIKIYDVIGAFSKLNRIDWRQSNKSILAGDEVFIYVGKPICSILFKCKVNRSNYSEAKIDDYEFVIDGQTFDNYGNYMELELLEKYDASRFHIDVLVANGMKGRVQGPRRVNELERLLNSNYDAQVENKKTITTEYFCSNIGQDVFCLAVGQTYDIVFDTNVTAHPNVAPYPSSDFNYLIPIKKGGSLEILYSIIRKISCLPNDVYKYNNVLNENEYDALIKYHERRKENFGYGKSNTKYVFYILEKYAFIKQPFMKKGIQVSVKLKFEDIPLEVKNENTYDYDFNEELDDKAIYNIELIADNLQIDGKDRKAYIKVRVNQGIFRERLLRKYDSCCLCKVSNPDFLVASHIKPWSVCDANEKLDSENGFLLCPNHDSLFDLGYISFSDDGSILISEKLQQNEINSMNIDKNIRINLTNKNKKYLEYHRNNIFRK